MLLRVSSICVLVVGYKLLVMSCSDHKLHINHWYPVIIDSKAEYTLFYTRKIYCRVLQVEVITDTDIGDKKGQVNFLLYMCLDDL